jgi:NADPH:quinone reductase-like Zn-dependent oxidoreductase
MKAIRQTKYGAPDDLLYMDVNAPTPPENRMLIKVRAASVNALDMHQVRGVAPILRLILRSGLRRPTDPRLGADFAGQVEEVGSKITQFQPGDTIFGRAPGTFAEYTCALETAVALKPANVTFEAAAAVPIAGITALQALRNYGKLQPGQKVAIVGAGGGVGTFAVQLAKVFGGEVTAICGPENTAMMREIGADHVIDYTQTDFTRQGQRYDLILGINGYYPLRAFRRVLRPTGTYLMVGADKKHLVRAMSQVLMVGSLLSRFGRKKYRLSLSNPKPSDLAYLAELLAAGKLVPVIDRRFSLREVPQALTYMEEGHTRGKIVITFDEVV